MISANEETAQREMAAGNFASFEDWYADLERRGVLEAHVGLYESPTATTVRVRDGEVLLTDGPYVEGAEVANGYYIIDVSDRDEAVKIASMIPATTVELRQLMGISGL
jgi:hypothetical protein